MSTQLQNKLMHYAPEPPAKVWEAIEASLEEGSSTLSNRLYTFEATPPSGVWNKIESALTNNEQTVKVVPFYRKHKKALQYSSAAVFIIAALISGLLISEKTKLDSRASVPTTTQPQQDLTGSKPVQQTDQSKNTALYSKNTDNQNDPNSFVEEKKTLLKRLRPQLKLGSIAWTKHFIPKIALTKQTVDKDAPVEKYMIYSDEEGNAWRLSKKLFDFFSCTKEETRCRQQLQQLQQQFASTSLTSDFTSLLEMLQKLKENQ